MGASYATRTATPCTDICTDIFTSRFISDCQTDSSDFCDSLISTSDTAYINWTEILLVVLFSQRRLDSELSLQLLQSNYSRYDSEV